MVRSLFQWFKPLCYALVFLALLACLLEIGLRVYDSATGQITRRDVMDQGLTAKSWFVHHSLKPARIFQVLNPDTKKRVRVAVNSRGMRGKEPAVPKPDDTYRVLCLGDEATLASYIAEADTFCARLEPLLRDAWGDSVETLNAGVPGYCPLLSLLQVRHQLLALEPDLVILSFDMSDVADDYALRRLAQKDQLGAAVSCTHPALEAAGGGKATRLANAFLLPTWLRQKADGYLAARALSAVSKSIESERCRYLWLEDDAPDWSAYIDHALEPIEQLANLLAARGARLVVTVAPAPWQVSAKASNGPGVREAAGVGRKVRFRSEKPFATVARFCHDRRIPVLNLLGAFLAEAAPEELYLTNAPQLSAQGHALFARELGRFLVEEWAPGAGGNESPEAEGVRQAHLPP
jgi:hypothetical protein